MTTVFVEGEPAPQGSKKAFTNPKTGKTILVESSAKVKPWRAAVAAAYPQEPLDGPVMVSIEFLLRRPKSVRRDLPFVQPDLDKLIRSTLDGLTGRAYHDDAQVVRFGTVGKSYADADDPPGAWITVTPAVPARTA